MQITKNPPGQFSTWKPKNRALMLANRENYRNSALVQCELYRQLVNKGYECYPELRYERCRFDLSIVLLGKIVILIECKDTKRRRINPNTRQFVKYSSFDPELLYCLNMEEIPNVIKEVDTIMSGLILAPDEE